MLYFFVVCNDIWIVEYKYKYNIHEWWRSCDKHWSTHNCITWAGVAHKYINAFVWFYLICIFQWIVSFYSNVKYLGENIYWISLERHILRKQVIWKMVKLLLLFRSLLLLLSFRACVGFLIQYIFYILFTLWFEICIIFGGTGASLMSPYHIQWPPQRL